MPARQVHLWSAWAKHAVLMRIPSYALARRAVSSQKSGAKSPSLSGLSREREADIMACHTSHVSPLEPATLCSKIWTYTASRMNRHANSSGGFSTCWKT